MPKYFPLFLDLQDKPCLVVGAGEIATRKAAQLLHYGARLTVVAPEASGTVREWAQEGRVHWHQREFRDSDVEGMLLVVASTDSSQVNRAIFDAASGRGILANIVDVPDLCNFVYGALVERGDLQIAISTSGRSPVFARHLKKEMEAQFGPEYAEYLEILGEARALERERGAPVTANVSTNGLLLDDAFIAEAERLGLFISLSTASIRWFSMSRLNFRLRSSCATFGHSSA